MNALLLSLALLVQQVEIESPAPAGLNSSLAWSAPTINADGTPCTDLAGYRIAISSAGADLNAGGAALAEADVPGSGTEARILSVSAGLSPGLYRLWALAYDRAGNRSAWSTGLLVSLDTVAPGVPAALRVRVRVEVEVGPSAP